jgi:DedD protein
MDLLSAFKRKTPPPKAGPASAAGDADEVQRARTRARQRLIGAAVLVVVGIIGFPLLFETQPRPIPVDLPIEIPRKDTAPPLALPAPAASTVAAVAPAPTSERVITETPAEGGRELAASAVATAPASAPSRTSAAPPPAASAAPPAPSARTADAARAQALLDGKPVPPAAGDEAAAGAARFVVQVGAFADANSVREVRAKVEKLGLKTYTNVAQTPDGARTRVRVGPFATRAEAERAAAKLKTAALPAAILTL